MNIIDVMKERRSVRSFDGEGLSTEQKSQLKKAIEETESPFGGKVTIRMKKFDL